METANECVLHYISGQKLKGECILENKIPLLKPNSLFRNIQNNELYFSNEKNQIQFKTEDSAIFDMSKVEPIITECQGNCINEFGEGFLYRGEAFKNKNYTFAGYWKFAKPYDGTIYFNKHNGACKDEKEKPIKCDNQIVFLVKDGILQKQKFYEKSEIIFKEKENEKENERLKLEREKEKIEREKQQGEIESARREVKYEKDREIRNLKYCDKEFQKCLQQPSIFPDKYDYCRTRMIQRDDCRKFYLNN